MHTFYYRPERMHATNFRAAAPAAFTRKCGANFRAAARAAFTCKCGAIVAALSTAARLVQSRAY